MPDQHSLDSNDTGRQHGVNTREVIVRLVDVPILTPEASLIDAGEAMHQYGVSAVVTRRDDQWVLLTTAAMHDAVVLRHDRQGGRGLMLADVPVLPGTSPMTVADPAPREVQTLSFVAQGPALQIFAACRPSQVCIVEHTGTLARVASFSVTHDRLIQMAITKGTCRDPQHHRWWPFELLVKDICNSDSSIVDWI